MKIIDKRTRGGRALSIRTRDNWIHSIVMSICFPPLARAVAVFQSSPVLPRSDGRTDGLIFDFADLVPRHEMHHASHIRFSSVRSVRKGHFLPGGTTEEL